MPSRHWKERAPTPSCSIKGPSLSGSWRSLSLFPFTLSLPHSPPLPFLHSLFYRCEPLEILDYTAVSVHTVAYAWRVNPHVPTHTFLPGSFSLFFVKHASASYYTEVFANLPGWEHWIVYQFPPIGLQAHRSPVWIIIASLWPTKEPGYVRS